MQHIKLWLADDFTLSKRQLGILMIIGGIIVAVGAIIFDLVSGSSGFGSSQLLALIAGIAALVIGVTLLPLGDQPA